MLFPSFYCPVIFFYDYAVFCSSVKEHLSCFYFLAITNKAAMNIHVHISVETCFHSLGCTWQNAIAGLYNNFNFLKSCLFSNIAVLFHICHSIFRYFQMLVFFIISFLVSMKLYLTVVLTCIFLLTNDVKLISYLLATCVLS